MALFDGDATLESVRVFRDGEGKATAVYATAHAVPTEVQGGQDEPAFSGESYLNLEIHLDNPREAGNLHQGASLHVTVDYAPEGGE